MPPISIGHRDLVHSAADLSAGNRGAPNDGKHSCAAHVGDRCSNARQLECRVSGCAVSIRNAQAGACGRQRARCHRRRVGLDDDAIGRRLKASRRPVEGDPKKTLRAAIHKPNTSCRGQVAAVVESWLLIERQERLRLNG